MDIQKTYNKIAILFRRLVSYEYIYDFHFHGIFFFQLYQIISLAFHHLRLVNLRLHFLYHVFERKNEKSHY